MIIIKREVKIRPVPFFPSCIMILLVLVGMTGDAQATNPQFQMIELSTVNNPNHVSAIQVIGELCYLGDHANGIRIFNISDPSNPSLLGYTIDSGIYHDLYVEGDMAYSADLEDGLVIFNVSDPRNPTRVGSYDVGEQAAAEIFVLDDIVYLAEFGDITPQGLDIFNATNPANIVKLAEYRPGAMSYCVQTVGNYCYITGVGLTILDVSDPTNPTFAGQYVDYDGVRYFHINNNLAYITTSDNGIKIVDVSDPTNPELLGTYTDLYDVIYLHQEGDYLFIGEWQTGLTILDVSDPTDPTFILELTRYGGVSSIHATGDYVLVGAMNTLIILEIISDVSSQSTPDYWGLYGLLVLMTVIQWRRKKHGRR